MDYENILYSVKGPAAWITINRPQVRNALDAATYLEMFHALEVAEASDPVRAVVLTGAGDRVFASGADLTFVNTRSPMEYRSYLEANRSVRLKIRGLAKPVVARVNGVAFAGAMGLATTCDLVVADRTAKFAQREIAVGLLGGVAHLRSLGPARTAEIMFTGRSMDAVEAERVGLINRAVDAADLDRVVAEYVDEIAAKSPIGIRLSKQALNYAKEVGFAEAEAYQHELVFASFCSEDRREGISAFLEKRTPQFTGQ